LSSRFSINNGIGHGWPKALISMGAIVEEVLVIHHQNNEKDYSNKFFYKRCTFYKRRNKQLPIKNIVISCLKKGLKIRGIIEKNSINCHKPMVSSNRFRIYRTLKLV